MEELEVSSLVESLPIESMCRALSTTSNPRKTRAKTATKTWQYARTAKDGELEQRGQVKILYYIHYTVDPPYSSYVTTNFRSYLFRAH